MHSSKQTKEEIVNILTQCFSPELLEVMDETHLHAGHQSLSDKPSLGYFKLTMKSKKFNNLSSVAKHRLVFDKIKHLMDTKIHAISMTLLSSN